MITEANPSKHYEQEVGREASPETQQELGDAAVDGALYEAQQEQAEKLSTELKISPTLAAVIAKEIDVTDGIHTGGTGVAETSLGEAGLGSEGRLSDNVALRSLGLGERPHPNSPEGRIDGVINEIAGTSPDYLVALGSDNEVFAMPEMSRLSKAESLEKTIATLEHILIRDPALMDNPGMRLVFPTTQVNAREGGGPTVVIGRELVKGHSELGTVMIETAVTYTETDDGGVEATGFTAVVRQASQEEKDTGNQWRAAENQAQAA